MALSSLDDLYSPACSNDDRNLNFDCWVTCTIMQDNARKRQYIDSRNEPLST